jgi:integrase
MKHLPSAATVAKLTKPGRYAVGHGAYLQVSEWRTKAWIFRFTRDGKAHHIGLGSCDYVTMAKAREKAIEYRRLLADGIDPLEQKHAAKLARRLADTRSKTFKQAADEYIAAHEGGWRGSASRRQWEQSLRDYAFPVLGDLPVGTVGVAEVIAVLERAADAPETQRRLRNRLASIFDWAIARELRNDNPAKRPGLIPKRKRQVTHFAAIDYRQMPGFLAELRQRPELAARALEFQILTAGRPGEMLGARWSEIEGNVWTIDGSRMKGGKPHRVPLSDAVVRLLDKLPRIGEYVFARSNGSRLHSQTMVRLLHDAMGRHETAHGFRSSFRDWAAETTAYPNHVVEQALAHAIGSGVEAAYRRGDLFEKRERLMADWAKFCARPSAAGAVVPIRKVEAPA